ncbi:NrfD/PsrC family molybdoenzyme membrane anchor subunit [Anaeromyxobacter sp. Fw109-5]|uniref:NrfD/PsrC family molybdoenzyme membrane anchor subunit n=1 Tax=Anaeromyxobacter sp. (strain Fw109-5) TaxID=404589 RepID=UPI0000ED8AF9|nr:NrfD/PsrC family molybdoenzyme membrane anchor subunit [Anaeromyxobacter sp. Fw109-5]ABS27281.1 Polysulphide reductase NrfD [Anaeromyxobacter sp. Fw109-5]
MPEISGYAFPNDVHVHWSLMIVMYPYITGFVAGAFIVTALYHLFGKKEFEPVARLALATSFCFMAIATFPLNLHLGHPERSLNVIVTPHFSSAMAGFGLLYSAYFVILLLEVWFVYRREIIETARRSRGLKRAFYASLALGTYDTSPEALEIDHRAVKVLSAFGLPAACMLHGYVGFIFGGIKANPWWSTPLMPVIFLLSAAVSGIALLVLLHQVTARLWRRPVERETVQAMARWLWFFLILTVTLELLEIVLLAYENSDAWHIISQLLTTRLEFSFISIQMIVGSLVPFILLAIIVTMNRYLHDRVRNTLAVVASLLLLVQVFAMRWNVVIGGQLLSKSFRGLRSGYQPELFHREGVLVAIGLFVLPFALLWVFDRVLPIEPASAPPEAGRGPAPEQEPARRTA